MAAIALVMAALSFTARADPVHEKNKRANRLYEQGDYEAALELYEKALVENPEEKRLPYNRGSAQFRLGKFDEAQESYLGSLGLKDKKELAAAYYNLGNAHFAKGEQLLQSGDQTAMEQFKKARESYIRALDQQAADVDSKWNLQLVQQRIKELEQQQQQNKDDKQNQEKDNKDQQKKDDQQKQDKDKQDQQNKDDQQKQDQDQQQQQDQQDQRKDQQQPQPQPDQSQEQMKKEEAQRLLQQFSDDEDELNKPRKRMRAIGVRKPEKDW